MKWLRKKEGLTLIELMIAIVCSAIVILTVSLIFFITYREWSIDNAYVQLRRDAALAVQFMSQDVRESSTNDIPPPTANSITFVANTNRPSDHIYTQTGDKLNSTPFGLIITKGLRLPPNGFKPSITNSGVLLHLELVNTGYGIAITNETFITVRN